MTNLQTVLATLMAEVKKRAEVEGWIDEHDHDLPDPKDCQIMANCLFAIGVDPDGYPKGSAT